MSYRIDFVDRGQKVQWLTCDPKTGIITDVGPFGRETYANGEYRVAIDQIETAKIIGCEHPGGVGIFRWPVTTITLDGVVIAKYATD